MQGLEPGDVREVRQGVRALIECCERLQAAAAAGEQPAQAVRDLAGRVGPLAEATRKLATPADLHEHPALLVRVLALPDVARNLVRLLDAGAGPEEVSRQAGRLLEAADRLRGMAGGMAGPGPGARP